MVELSTDRLILRELTMEDVPALHIVESHPAVAQWVWLPGPNLAETRSRVESIVAGASAVPRTTYILGMVTKTGNQLVGRCGFDVTGRLAHEGEIGYALHPDHWGRGYMTEAVRALIGFGFGELGLHRFWAEADPRNHGSWRVMEKVGMRREGHLVENYLFDGEWCDTFYYAILAREWPSAS